MAKLSNTKVYGNLDVTGQITINDTLIQDTFISKNELNSTNEKINNIEQANMTMATNIINIQNDINSTNSNVDVLNNKLTPKQDISYTGDNITCNNSFVGKTSNIVIQGRTYQNLIIGGDTKLSLNFSTSTQVKLLFSQPLKQNTEYTLIYKGENISDINAVISVNVGGCGVGISAKNGFNKQLLNTGTIDNLTGLWIYYDTNISDKMTGTIEKVVLLEGDWTDKEVPTLITGIESSGERENKISILSSNKNLFDISKYQPTLNMALDDKNGYVYELSTHSGNWYAIQQYIPIPSIDIGSYLSACSGSTICYYDEQKNFLGSSTDKNIKPVPNGTKYCRFDIYKDYINCFQLEKGKQSTYYVPHKEDKKEILLPIEGGLKSLPDGTCDTIEQRDGVYLVQRIGKTVISHDTEITEVSRSGEFKRSRIKINIAGLPLGNYMEFITNSFVVADTVGDMYGYIATYDYGSFIFVYHKTDNIQQWLQANPITIYYKLATPIETKLDIDDIDLDTYENVTLIYSDNSIKPDLRVEISSNLYSSTQHNMELFKNKISYLEKDTRNLNEQSTDLSTKLTKIQNKLDDNQYLKNDGYNFVYSDSLLSNTSDMLIKGQTIQNILPEVSTQNFSFQYADLDNDYLILPLGRDVNETAIRCFKGKIPNLRSNMTYTMIVDVVSNDTDCNLGMSSYSSALIPETNSFSNKLGISKMKCTTGDIVNQDRNNDLYFCIWGNNGDKTKKIKFKAMLLEGDWTNKEIPFNLFQGIKSSGDSNNKITIFSHGKNLCAGLEWGGINETPDLLGADYPNKAYMRTKYIDVSNIDSIAFNVWNNNINISFNTVLFYDENNKGIRAPQKAVVTEVPDNAKYCRFEIKNNDNLKDISKWIPTTRCMIIASTKQPNNFEPYMEDIKEINLPFNDGLKSLPNGICDSIEQFEDGIYAIQRIKKVDLTKLEWVQTNLSNASFMAKASIDDILGFCIEHNYFYTNLDMKYDLRWNVSEWANQDYSLAINCQNTDYTGIEIIVQRNKVSSITNLDTFKQYLKENKAVLYYQLSSPIITKLNIESIDLNMYNAVTFISSKNTVKPLLHFKSPSNFYSSTVQNTSNIKKEINFSQKNNVELNNRVDNIEKSNVTIATNIVDLQNKYNSIDSNLKEKQNLEYNGKYFNINNCYNSKTTNMRIEGEMLQNLIDFKAFNKSYHNEDHDITYSYDDGIITLKYGNDDRVWSNMDSCNIPMIKNMQYTLIVICVNAYDKDKISFQYTLTHDNPSTVNFASSDDLVKKILLQPSTDNETMLYFKFFRNSDTNTDLQIQLMLLQGDWTNKEIPQFFEGIKSVGDEVNIVKNSNIISQWNIEEALNVVYNNDFIKIIRTQPSGDNRGIYKDFPVKGDTVYTLSMETGITSGFFGIGGSKNIWNYYVPDSQRTLLDNSKQSFTFRTEAKEKNVRLYFTVSQTSAVNSYTEIKNIQLEEGNSASYYNGKRINIFSSNKNLFNKYTDLATNQWIDSTHKKIFSDNSGLNYSISYDRVKEGKTYSITYNIKNENTYRCNYAFVNNKNTVLAQGAETTTCAAPSGANKLIYYVCSAGLSSDEIDSLQLEEGNTKTDFIAHEGNTKEIVVPEILKLPNGTCDIIEQRYDGVYLIQRVQKVILNGSEDWGQYTEDRGETTRYFKIQTLIPKHLSSCISSIYGGADCSNNAIVNNFDTPGFCFDENEIRIRIKRELLTSQDIPGLKQYLKNNPITLYYELNTPIEKKLKTNEINLTTLKDYTCIATNSIVQPILNFNAPSNLYSLIQQNSKEINNIYYILDKLMNNINLKTNN